MTWVQYYNSSDECQEALQVIRLITQYKKICSVQSVIAKKTVGHILVDTGSLTFF